jgi:hypothetical protein
MLPFGSMAFQLICYYDLGIALAFCWKLQSSAMTW